LCIACRRSGATPLSGTFLTNRPTVRIRESPSARGKVRAQLPLGSTVALDGHVENEWLHVWFGRNEGWMIPSALVPIQPGHEIDALERVVTDSLVRDDDDFPGRVELVELIESYARRQIMEAKFETRGRFALYDLQAVSRAAVAVPSAEGFLNYHKEQLQWDGPGGSWMLNRQAFLNLYDRYRGTRSGDELLWAAVCNGVPGECEGDIGCYLSRVGLLEGTYLREEPHGRHAHDAMVQLAERASRLADGPRRPDFDSTTDCPRIIEEGGHLREVVEGSGVAGGDRALAALDRLVKSCES